MTAATSLTQASPSPSNTAATAPTAPDDNHNSQLGDVAGNAQDQGLELGSTTMAAPLQPQLGLSHPQPGSSRDTSPTLEADSLDNPIHRLVKNLSSIPLTQAQRSLLTKGPNYAITPRQYTTAIE